MHCDLVLVRVRVTEPVEVLPADEVAAAVGLQEAVVVLEQRPHQVHPLCGEDRDVLVQLQRSSLVHELHFKSCSDHLCDIDDDEQEERLLFSPELQEYLPAWQCPS